MITYRYAEVEIKDEAYVFIELLDYDQGKDRDIFDTINYNNKSFRGKSIIMHDEKIIPGPTTFYGATGPLRGFLKSKQNTESLTWRGPFTL